MSSKTNADCCADGHEGPALKLADALERILAEVKPVVGSETVAVRSALGRVLAADVESRIDVPSHTNSAMDGYAVIGADLSAGDEIRLEVIGTSAAGRPFHGAVSPFSWRWRWSPCWRRPSCSRCRRSTIGWWTCRA